MLMVATFYAIPGSAQMFEPLIPVETIDLPDVPEGPYTDHLCIDIKGHRLFTTMQAQKAVAVVDWIMERSFGIFLSEILTLVRTEVTLINCMSPMGIRRNPE